MWEIIIDPYIIHIRSYNIRRIIFNYVKCAFSKKKKKKKKIKCEVRVLEYKCIIDMFLVFLTKIFRFKTSHFHY